MDYATLRDPRRFTGLVAPLTVRKVGTPTSRRARIRTPGDPAFLDRQPTTFPDIDPFAVQWLSVMAPSAIAPSASHWKCWSRVPPPHNNSARRDSSLANIIILALLVSLGGLSPLFGDPQTPAPSDPSRRASGNVTRDSYRHFRYMSGLPGQGWAVSQEGLVGFRGALQMNVPVAYTPFGENIVIAGNAGSEREWRLPTRRREGTTDILDGGAIAGLGLGPPERGYYLSYLATNKGSAFTGAWMAQHQLMGEQRVRPAVAVGLLDVFGNRERRASDPDSNARSFYAVATKRLGGARHPIYGTLGVGTGAFGGGPFGGLSYRATSRLTAMAEYDGSSMNVGFAASLFRRPDLRRRNVCLSVGLVDLKFPSITVAATFAPSSHKPEKKKYIRAEEAPSEATETSAEGEPSSSLGVGRPAKPGFAQLERPGIEAELVSHGFAEVSLATDGEVVLVEYADEDNGDPLVRMALVLSVVASRTPDAELVVAVLRSGGRQVLRAQVHPTQRDAELGLLLTEDQFAEFAEASR